MLLLNGLCTNSNFGRQMKKLAHQDCYARLSYYKAQWVEIISENDLYAPIEEWILEAKTDCYGKDQLFVASFAFCVITFEPIMI